jgi:S-adenosylmethionine synthetase
LLTAADTTLITPLVETRPVSGLLVRSRLTELTPKGIIESLDLRRPIYRKTAAYGHFGRTENGFPWEATDKAAVLKEQAGVEAAK